MKDRNVKLSNLSKWLLLGCLWSPMATSAAVIAVEPVQQANLASKMMVSGTVMSKYQSNVSAGVDGRLDWIRDIGAQVKAGEVLARIDALPLELRHQEIQVKIKRKSIELARLKREQQRFSSLAKTNVTSQTRFEQAKADYELAELDIELFRVQLQQIDDQIARTQVRAPFDGVVSARYFQQGEDVGRADGVLRLVNLSTLEIQIFAPLKYYQYVTPGELLSVYSNRGEFQARINSVIPVSDNRSQTFEVRLAIEHSTPGQVGELVSVALPTSSVSASLLVPRDAVVIKEDKYYVFKLVADDKVQRVAVTLGQGLGDSIQIFGELAPEDSVVVRGAESLEDQDEVQILSRVEYPLTQG